MTAMRITDIGTFMNRLLKDGVFDHFLLQEASLTRAVTHTVDGSISPDYYDPEEMEAMGLSGLKYMPFGNLRALFYELMKGRKKPLAFKFIFLLSPRNQSSTVEKSGSGFRTGDISGMYINLTYKNNSLICATGISYRTFSLERTLEQEWDRLVGLFLRQHGIAFEQEG